MASNLQILNIYFKEFTFENQDLLLLKFLKEVNIKCLAKVNKYQPLKHEYFQMQFFNPNNITLTIELPNFNILLHEVFERFNWGRLPVSRFRLFANKIKFVDGEHVFLSSKQCKS